MNWKRKGKELAGKNRREMAVGSLYRERKDRNNWEGKRWKLVKGWKTEGKEQELRGER